MRHLRQIALLVLGCGVVPASAEWSKEQGIRVADGSVPFVYALDGGGYRLYYCGRGGIQSARSTDGLNFTAEPGVRIGALPGPQNPESIVCDPSLVKLDDGRYRLYYKGGQGSGGPGQSIHRVFSAVSTDGLEFTREGLRLESLGTEDRGWASVPEVIRTFDQRWRMYYVSDSAEAHGIASAISDDGLNFTREPGIRIPGMVDPAIVALSNGQYWLFGMIGLGKPPGESGIYSATSADGVNFVLDPGPLVQPGGPYDTAGIYDPTVVPLPDGHYRMYYGAAAPQQPAITLSAVGRRVENPSFGSGAAVSAADPLRQTLTPGSIATLWGERMTVDPEKTLVRVNGITAHLHYASATQINFVVPGGITQPTAHIVATGSDGRQTTALAPLAPVAPSLFTLPMSGSGEAAAQDALTYELGPFEVGSRERLLALYATGLRNAADVKVRLGGIELAVLYAGPQLLVEGLDQVNVRIAAGFPLRGRQSLEVEAGGRTTAPGVFITLR